MPGQRVVRQRPRRHAQAMKHGRRGSPATRLIGSDVGLRNTGPFTEFVLAESSSFTKIPHNVGHIIMIWPDWAEKNPLPARDSSHPDHSLRAPSKTRHSLVVEPSWTNRRLRVIMGP